MYLLQRLKKIEKDHEESFINSKLHDLFLFYNYINRILGFRWSFYTKLSKKWLTRRYKKWLSAFTY